jgi:hypothetical protein
MNRPNNNALLGRIALLPDFDEDFLTDILKLFVCFSIVVVVLCLDHSSFQQGRLTHLMVPSAQSTSVGQCSQLNGWCAILVIFVAQSVGVRLVGYLLV